MKLFYILSLTCSLLCLGTANAQKYNWVKELDALEVLYSHNGLFASTMQNTIIRYDAKGNIQWQIKGPRAYLAADKDGNIYGIGTFSDSARIGTTKLTSNGLADVFIIKCSLAGDLIWVKSFGGITGEYGRKIAVAQDGSIYLGGSFDSIATIGSTMLTAHGTFDAWLAKADKDGNIQWAKNFGGTDYDGVTDLEILNDGTLYLSGTFGYSMTVDSKTTLTARGSVDGFLLKMDNSGQVKWARSVGGTSFDNINSIASDGNENIYLTGSLTNTVKIGTTTLKCDQWGDAFLAKFDSAGNVGWAKRFGGTYADGGSYLLVGPDNKLYATGGFSETCDFGNGNSKTSNGEEDIYLGSFSLEDGSLNWVLTSGSDGEDAIGSLSMDSSAQIYFCGFSQGTLTFGDFTINGSFSGTSFMGALSSGSTGINESEAKQKNALIWQEGNNLMVKLLNPQPGQTEISLVSLSGSQLGSWKKPGWNNTAEVSIPVDGLSSGLYLVRIQNGNNFENVKVLIRN